MLQDSGGGLVSGPAALVGIENLRLALAQRPLSLFRRRKRRPKWWTGARPPSSGFASRMNQIQKSFGHGDVGDVRRPHLLGARSLLPTQELTPDLALRRRPTGPRPPVDGHKPQGPPGRREVKRLSNRDDQRRNQPDRRETRIYGAGHRYNLKYSETLGDCAKSKGP